MLNIALSLYEQRCCYSESDALHCVHLVFPTTNIFNEISLNLEFARVCGWRCFLLFIFIFIFKFKKFSLLYYWLFVYLISGEHSVFERCSVLDHFWGATAATHTEQHSALSYVPDERYPERDGGFRGGGGTQDEIQVWFGRVDVGFSLFLFHCLFIEIGRLVSIICFRILIIFFVQTTLTLTLYSALGSNSLS
jgi:hypothetical protein